MFDLHVAILSVSIGVMVITGMALVFALLGAMFNWDNWRDVRDAGPVLILIGVLVVVFLAALFVTGGYGGFS